MCSDPLMLTIPFADPFGHSATQAALVGALVASYDFHV